MSSLAFSVPVTGWYTESLVSPITLTSNHYWLVFTVDSGNIQVAYNSGGTSNWHGSYSLPNPFVTGSAWANTPSIYASYAHS